MIFTHLAFLALLFSRAQAIGINLGNVLEAPTEGAWAPVAEEYYFDDYVSKGFTHVRVPVRWDKHLGTSPPYTIDPVFLSRVHEIVSWGLSRNLTLIINTHHDDWMDSTVNYTTVLPRFLSLWNQVSTSFSTAPPTLYFEVINEPISLNITQLNDLYSKVIPVMRANNPTRGIFMGGLAWMGPEWVLDHPDAVIFPSLPDGTKDSNLHLEVHSYNPYNFCLQSPPTASSWGTPSDIAAVQGEYTGMQAWGASHGRQVIMGEAGCQVSAPSRADRLLWYKTIGAASKDLFFLTVWDDDGSWKLYNRDQRTWDEEVLANLFGTAAN